MAEGGSPVELGSTDSDDGRDRSRLQATLDSLLDPFALFEVIRDDLGRAVDLRFTDVNGAAVVDFRVPRERLIGAELLRVSQAFQGTGLIEGFVDTIGDHVPLVLDDYLLHVGARRTPRWYDLRGVQVGDLVAVTWRDVTARHEAERRLVDSEQRYRMLAENASDVVWQVDRDGRLLWTSESTAAVLGWTAEQVSGRAVIDLIHPDDRPRAAAHRAEIGGGVMRPVEYRVACADGTWRWMLVTVRFTERSLGQTAVLALRDIAEEVLARQELQDALRHDARTGLATPAAVGARLATLVDHLPGTTALGVLQLAVDGLPAPDEASSRARYDLALERVAARVAAVVADPELIGQGPGDDVVVLTGPLAAPADAVPMAEALLEAVRAPLVVSGQELHPTVSIGIATGGRGSSAEALTRDAALALQRARADGGDRWAVLDPAVSESAERRRTVESAIREALRAGGCVPYLQPIVRLPAGDIVGYEALIRLVKPDGSVWLPDDFLAVAEARGLVADLDRVVLEASLEWLARLPADRFIAVNVAPATVGRAGYAGTVLAALDRHGVAPERLHLEVTETTLLAVTGEFEHALADLADAGVRWYVDDFGTGYSAISHLRTLPVAGLKLDRSFTAGIGAADGTSIRLARALAGLAEGLGLDTVVEGVETVSQAVVLTGQGWRHAQGWRYGRPQPVPADLA